MDLERGTAGAAFVVGEFDAVDVCFGYVGVLAEDFGDFGGCAGGEELVR